MPFYAVTFDHPDAAGWRKHVGAHVEWLRERLADGSVRASGPFRETAHHSALLIMAAPDRTALNAIIATDPFAVHGLIENMTVTEWDPIFGAFATESSMPGLSAA